MWTGPLERTERQKIDETCAQGCGGTTGGKRNSPRWRILLKWVHKEISWKAWIGFMCLGTGGKVVGFCELGNETSDSTQCGEF